MKIKLKYLVFIAYVALVASLFVVSLTMARYVSNIGTEGSFEIGDQLYFNYERSVLYRGDQLIVGKEVYDAEFGGTIIETMNVAPGDNITYHFYRGKLCESLLLAGSIWTFAVFPVPSCARMIPTPGESC